MVGVGVVGVVEKEWWEHHRMILLALAAQ